jgi:hypothetical protein
VPSPCAVLLVGGAYRVHVFDPDGVHGPIEDDPLPIRRVVARGVAEGDGEDPVRPLLGHRVVGAVQLPHGDGLGVDHVELALELVVEPLQREKGACQVDRQLLRCPRSGTSELGGVN